MTYREHIILNPELYKKFKDAVERFRIILFRAPCGAGKTAAANKLLSGRKVYQISEPERDFSLPAATDPWDFLLVDNLHDLCEEEQKHALYDLICSCSKKRFVLLTRGSAPDWTIHFQYAGLMETITLHDLFLTKETVQRVLKQDGITPTEAELDWIYRTNRGYPLAVASLVQRIRANGGYGPACITQGRVDIYHIWRVEVLYRLDLDLRQVLIELSPFERLDLELVRMISGDNQARSLLDTLQRNTDMFIIENMNEIRFRPIFRDYLLWEMENTYSDDRRRALYSRCGVYYELKQDYSNALKCYTQGQDYTKVSSLLVKRSKLHAGMGHYQDMAEYYHALPEQDIKSTPSLMQAMSMLYALEMDYDASELWYRNLERYAEEHREDGAAYREARSYLANLTIALPQRSVRDLVTFIPEFFRLIKAKSVYAPQFSVTSTLPSCMNGGKDFSEWSKKDDFLYTVLRLPLMGILGADGVGLPECAIAESKFEKGKDISDRMLSLVSMLSEIQHHGTPDIEFVVIGLLARVQLCAGQHEEAKRTLLTIRERYQKKGLTRFLPTMDAFLCRIALRSGDMEYAGRWYDEKAPKDPQSIWTLKRYLYLTQAMVELAQGAPHATLLTLSPLEPYFTRCQRNIDSIHLLILQAIALHRQEKASWKERMAKALDTASEYHFVRTVGEYGGAVLPLLEQCGWKDDGEFLKLVLKMARTEATFYPNFLRPAVALSDPLSSAELHVLRLLCDDRSNKEIAEILGIKLTTVKSHIMHIFQKLNVKRRSEAKSAAKKLRLLENQIK